MRMELWNLCLNVAELLGGCIIGLFCFFWIRPADRRMKHLEAEIAKQNARQAKIQATLIDARVGHREKTHQKCCDACEVVYKAFIQVDSASGILFILKDIKNLSTIKLNINNQAQLSSFAELLETMILPGWEKATIFSEAKEVEPFASERIWQLYELARSLLFGAQTKIAELQLNISLLDEQKLYSQISLFFPEERPFLEKWGTSRYYRILERCRWEMKKEMRKIFGLEPINSEFAKTLESDISSLFGMQRFKIPKEFQVTHQKGFGE